MQSRDAATSSGAPLSRKAPEPRSEMTRREGGAPDPHAATRLPWSTNEAQDNARAEAEWRERHLMISYPFPCEDDMIANLRLPKYLTQADADRLKAVIDTLVIGQ